MCALQLGAAIAGLIPALTPELIPALVPGLIVELIPELILELIPELVLEPIPELIVGLIPELMLVLIPELILGLTPVIPIPSQAPRTGGCVDHQLPPPLAMTLPCCAMCWVLPRPHQELTLLAPGAQLPPSPHNFSAFSSGAAYRSFSLWKAPGDSSYP